ncbi:MAG: hypothetical protein KGD61_08610 [Candidatus Lokiarchaeota archaeon]|nr:hypothetical protein [Candidatus Lokiarchaeota archaeon]
MDVEIKIAYLLHFRKKLLHLEQFSAISQSFEKRQTILVLSDLIATLCNLLSISFLI